MRKVAYETLIILICCYAPKFYDKIEKRPNMKKDNNNKFIDKMMITSQYFKSLTKITYASYTITRYGFFIINIFHSLHINPTFLCM